MAKKWITLSVLLFGGATVLNGCLNSFWQGFFNKGWPSNNRYLNIGLDVLNEELFG